MLCSDIAYSKNRKIAISFPISNDEEGQNRSDIEWDDYMGGKRKDWSKNLKDEWKNEQ